LGGKGSRWHLESRVNAIMIVVVDVAVDSLDHFANGVKPVHIAQLMLEAAKE
jgi:hypothetical protein